jgi:enoyl-CoA hydratase/carnithine racemase
MSEVQVTTQEGVCEIALARPKRKNALTLAMYSAMTEALAVAGREPAVRAVLLHGEGGNFTSGNDLNDFMQNPLVGEDSPVGRFLQALSTFEKPVAAAVEGHAIGVGTTLLLHCDLVWAAPTARFQLPFVNLALVPEAASSYLLPRLCGHARAAELLFFGEPFDAATAKDLGLINGVADGVVAHARARVRQLADKPAESLRLTKRLLRAPLADEVKRRIRAEGEIFVERLASDELREAITAFFEKRPPRFR